MLLKINKNKKMAKTLTVHKTGITGHNKKMFVDFFDSDGDFSENEDYWREDTESLGYASESERCSEELYNDYKERLESAEENHTKVLEEALEEAAGFEFEDTQFIAGNTSYTGKYVIHLICTDEESKEYVVVLSMLNSQ